MTNNEAITQEFRRLYQDWMDAVKRKDRAACELILAEEYVYTASGQGRWDRQGWLDTLPRYDLRSFELMNVDMRIYGDVAVGITHSRQEALVAGAERGGDFLITDVWIKRDGRWQVVARSSIMQQPAESKS